MCVVASAPAVLSSGESAASDADTTGAPQHDTCEPQAETIYKTTSFVRTPANNIIFAKTCTTRKVVDAVTVGAEQL